MFQKMSVLFMLTQIKRIILMKNNENDSNK